MVIKIAGSLRLGGRPSQRPVNIARQGKEDGEPPMADFDGKMLILRA